MCVCGGGREPTTDKGMMIKEQMKADRVSSQPSFDLLQHIAVGHFDEGELHQKIRNNNKRTVNTTNLRHVKRGGELECILYRIYL